LPAQHLCDYLEASAARFPDRMAAAGFLVGPTETNVCAFARIPTPIPQDRSEPYPIGWPCSHCAAMVLDTEGKPASPDPEGLKIAGLLYIAGPAVSSGYRGRPEESAAVFVDRDGTRWYNTGDVVTTDPIEGFLYVGRKDRMVKRHGYRIELGEIESCLYRHPAVAEAAVIAEQHPETGRNPDVFVFVSQLPRTSTNKVDYPALARIGSGA
jgi:acyl-coenzyme A synthetase/AMP-(fatty) acid ligase